MIPLYHALSILAIFGGIVSCSSTVKEQNLEGRNISSLSFRYTGAKTIKEEFLRLRIQSLPGTKYSAEKVDADIGSLYNSGLVDDILVDAKPAGESVRLIMVVTMPPPCGPPGFIGNMAFSDQKLALQTGLHPGCQLHQADLKKAASAIEIFYKCNGYPDARVTVKSFKGGLPTIDDFVFVIIEGSRNTSLKRPAKEAEHD